MAAEPLAGLVVGVVVLVTAGLEQLVRVILGVLVVLMVAAAAALALRGVMG
jgi:uncharacterized membrane protein